MKKVVLLGDSAVGKTSLVRRFVEDRFDDDYISTIGAKVSKKILPIDFKGAKYQAKLMVWDIIGSKGFETTQSRHIAGVNGAILVADLTKPETLDSLEGYWIPLLMKVSGGVLPTMLFAGNKKDLVESTGADIQGIMRKLKALETKYCGSLDARKESGCGGWLLTSAKTGVNVEKGFRSLVLGMLETHPAFDPLNRQMEEMVAESIYVSADHDTPRSMMDLIVIDLPQVMRSTEQSSQILQEVIEELGFSKDDPTIEDVRNFIEMAMIRALEMDARPDMVENYRKKWVAMLSRVG